MQREQGDSSETQSGQRQPTWRSGGTESKAREGRRERKEDTTRGRPREEGGCAEARGAETRGDLHLSFRSVSGTSDGELVQHAGVSFHLVDDKHLREKEGSVQAPGSLPLKAPRGPGSDAPLPATCTNQANFLPPSDSPLFSPCSPPLPPLPCNLLCDWLVALAQK